MKWIKNERGDVAQFVIVLAVLAVIISFVFNQVKLQSAVTVMDAENHVEMAFSDPDE